MERGLNKMKCTEERRCGRCSAIELVPSSLVGFPACRKEISQNSESCVYAVTVSSSSVSTHTGGGEKGEK